jgi:single-stranded DNA-specific DHH superfamily exonuclease
MLTPNQIASIRTRLEESQNPLFLFDNDADGLCSFLLLRRFIDRGIGFPVKTFPELNATYAIKLEEINPDVLFILDKALVSMDFLKMVHQKNIPVVWIDHHNVPIPELSEFPNIEYYNPLRTDNPSSEPTTYWAWLVTHNKSDLWIAMVGCLADAYIPNFSMDLVAQYPELWREVSDFFEGRYETQIGRIWRIFSFGLKDRTSSLVNSIKFLCSVKSPHEILTESMDNTLLLRYSFLNRKYQELIAKAKSSPVDGDIVYFQYGGDLSISADLSDELFYYFRDKVVVVAFISGSKANISIRSKRDILSAATSALNDIEGATGGGHRQAVGASMPAEDVLRFKDKFKENLQNKL